MKLLLTGANGQVGWELARTLMPLGNVVALDRTQADLSDFAALKTIIKQEQPDVIVNPAAYTAVDKAESEQSLALAVNAQAPGILAEEAKKIGALLVHYSTDYVFDGTLNSFYSEDEPTHPLNVYGQSKLAGEQAIQSLQGDYLIFRTSWVYASRGSNFLKTILRLAAEREELKIVSDQIGSPTWARLIAETTAHAIKQAMTERKQGAFHSDVYNLTASGETSWHGFAEKILALAAAQGNFAIKTRVVKPIPASEFPVPAKRPANSRLSTARLQQQFGLTMPSWDNALALCMREL